MHPREALPLVEAIMVCTAYEDLEIVPITFRFWWMLAPIVKNAVLDQVDGFQSYLEIYGKLQKIIIGHLHFPSDDEQQSPQERDEFRTFRHRMGDTLKDCCQVLGAPTCLRASYELVVEAMGKPSPSWQEIEAPLFSMRSMGAEVDRHDDEVMPHVMDLLPRLPDHPRIRYAAILVISRYTEWIDLHPQNIAFQLQYISAGFDMAEDEVSAAAAQAMKYMCQDCRNHLVPFLPQLHTFVTTVGKKLDQQDMVEVSEAIAHVITSLPAADAATALQQFTQPLIETVQRVASAPEEAPKQELQRVADALEQLDAYLAVIRTLEPVPESCYPTASSVYAVLDALLARYARLYYISERAGSILRRGLSFFPEEALVPIVQPVLARLSSSFSQTGYASYLWITGKVASKFAAAARRPGSEVLVALLRGAFENVTETLSKLLQIKNALEIADVMDDYVHCFMAYIQTLPQQTIASPACAVAVSHTLAALNCASTQTILTSLDTLNMLSAAARDPTTASPLHAVFAQYAKPLFALLLDGVVRGYPANGFDSVPDILRAVCASVTPAQAEQFATEGLTSVPGNVLPAADKQAFVTELHGFLANQAGDGLKSALIDLMRAGRRTRDRGRQSRKSLGA
jgi:transportin-3